jgi:hypothetical protein
MTKKKDDLKLVFSEGCFDNFEGTPEELAELLAEINRLHESGELIDNSRPLTPEEEEELLFMIENQKHNQRQ